jgi:F-type H+-transporting ATPase subunit delta
MPPRVSGKRYAQAIFELALERDRLDQWDGDLEFIDQVLRDDEFRALLEHADVPVGDKMKAIEAVFPDIDPLVRNLVNLLVTKGLVDLVRNLRAAYTELLDAHLGRQRVQVTSAVPLEPRELERITQFVANLVRQEVVVSTDVDDSILGGVVVQIGDRLLDGSTRSRLDALRNRMHSEVAAPGP